MTRKLGSLLRCLADLLPLGQPYVRLSEANRGVNGGLASELDFKSEGVSLRVSRLGARRSSYRDFYRVIRGRQLSGPIAVRWAPAGVNRFEVHGQVLAAFEGDRKVAELEVVAQDPTTVRLVSDVSDGVGSPYPEVRVARGTGNATFSVRRAQFQVVERNVGREDLGWTSWQNSVHLNYLLDVPEAGSGLKSLIVVFSSLGRDYDFTYNYRAALQGSESYRLFLLDDFGTRGSYYFSDHRDMTIYNDVQKFLAEIITKLGISMDRVIFAGSSKGGTAALIHGVGLGVGQIIVGAPQVFPGSYLQDNAPAVLGFIAGGADNDAKKWLDNAVVSRISRLQAETSVRIIIGEQDHHLKRHIRPLLDLVASHGPDIQALILPGLNHRDIGSVYRHYLRNIVDRDAHSQTADIFPYTVENTAENQLKVKVWKPKKELVACHLYRGTQLVEKKPYAMRDEFTFTVPSSNEIRFRIFRRREGEALAFAWFYTPYVNV